VSTVRFAKVIEACGKPDIHLLLIDPAKDKTLQAAIKSDRVMTLHQQSGGTDHGVVGFEQGRSRQFLVFPKPLKPFLGQRIVGIKYELLEGAPAPKKETTKKQAANKADEHPGKPAATGKDRESPKWAEVQTPTVVPEPSAPKPEGKASDLEKKRDQENRNEVSEDKVVKFQKTAPERQPAPESNEIREIKRQVQQAMEALEQGKQIVAFNLLKRILDTD
jgi:hypothetical protein